ncbi:MAG: hypothetical protein CXT68_03015 [Methanobacteriota archaeon]|nr:MAG: hypothetical protein CXT68_03015 [Euryarchaeota archaeon]
MSEEFTMIIDGTMVVGQAGQTVMQVARDNDIKIPSLCDSPHLAAFGSCRMCIVEVEGMRGTPSSCTTPASSGMQVATTNDRLWDLRRGLTELYVSEHPLDCLTCTANGDCELQDVASEVGLREVRYDNTPSCDSFLLIQANVLSVLDVSGLVMIFKQPMLYRLMAEVSLAE